MLDCEHGQEKSTPKKVKKKKTKKPPTKKSRAEGKSFRSTSKKSRSRTRKLRAQREEQGLAKAKVKVAAPQTACGGKQDTPRRKYRRVRRASVARGSQEVETVRLKPKSRVARAGTGAGDLQGISIVEDVDSESADELLEEGQAFEAGIVSGVERAGNAEESEVVTQEVLEDDVPKEYDDQDRP